MNAQWPFIIGGVISAALLIASFGMVYVGLESGTLLVINYDAYRGIDFLGEKGNAYGILTFAFAVTLINAGLVAALYPRKKFLAYFIGGSTLLFLSLIFLAIFVIVRVN